MSGDGVLHVVLGATGHIGSGVASALLARGAAVRVVTRSAQRGADWAARGAEVAMADAGDAGALTGAFSSDGPVRVFALNPPAPVATDTDAGERRTADSIVAALAAARPERVVALSTYGARPGSRIGDLGTLHRFEQLLGELHGPVAVLRAGYLFSNWDGALDEARTEGTMHASLDLDRPIPMVAPRDVGAVAAGRMRAPVASTGLVHVEGPRRSTARDVADAFAAALGHAVEAVPTPAEQWLPGFLAAGFSPQAAASYAGLTAVAHDEEWALDTEPVRGATTLQQYVTALVEAG